MKKIMRLTVLIILTVFLMSCIDTTVLVRVNKDGSGTIEETVIISKSFMELIGSMGGGDSEKDKELLNEEELREKARKMGEGVRLVSTEKIDNETGSGYKAMYRFEDINKIRINQNPGENIPTPPTGAGEEGSPEEFIVFKFNKGNTAKLEIINPIQPPKPADEGEKEKAQGMDMDNPAMLDMMKQIYKDMKIGIYVEVDGRIVETNAAYHEGSQITIMELDFARLLEDEETFNKLIQSEPETLEEMKKIVKDNPGIKVETAEKILVRFK